MSRKSPSLQERIENSSFAQRPIWFTSLCALVFLLGCIAIFILLGSLFSPELRSQVSIPLLLHGMIVALAECVAAVMLWRSSRASLWLWPAIALDLLIVDVALSSTPTVKNLIIPILMSVIAFARREKSDDVVSLASTKKL